MIQFKIKGEIKSFATKLPDFESRSGDEFIGLISKISCIKFRDLDVEEVCNLQLYKREKTTSNLLDE